MITFDIDDLYNMPQDQLCGDWPVKEGHYVVGLNHNDYHDYTWSCRFIVVSAPVDDSHPEDEISRRNRGLARA